jgi:UDP-N-acetylglucosamine 2-epimerase (non-hydrolysing)/GDP/UDP-N,N'-diacetylbacillosamine 2-epimerase (hydrolysing)
VVYHPVTLLQDTTRESAALFTALSSVKSPLIFMYPNADAGSRKLIERAQRFVSEHPDSRLLVNFDHVTYLSLLARVSALIGNSSSGIIEAAALGLPVVNIGLRQKGREFRRSLRRLDNPYGDGHASKTIAHLLATVPLGDRLLFKRSS